MSWSTRTFFTGSADSVEEAVTSGLAGFAVGERLERLDRMRPCIEWWTLPVRGGMLDEVVHVTAVRVHPGDRVPLRSAEWSIRLARSITAHSESTSWCTNLSRPPACSSRLPRVR